MITLLIMAPRDNKDLPPEEDQRQVQPDLRLDAHQRIQSRGKVQFKVLKGKQT